MILKRLLVLLLLLIFTQRSFSQNPITGTWNGLYLSSQLDLGRPKLVVEIYNFKDSIFSGITHLYYEGNLYEHYKMVGRYFKKDSILVFIEAATIAVDLGDYGNCLGTYVMKLSKKGNMLYQQGNWESNKRGCSPSTEVFLQKQIELVKEPSPKKETVKKKVPEKPAPMLKEKMRTPVMAEPSAAVPATGNKPVIKAMPTKIPAQISQRETDVQSILEIEPLEKDSIKVEVYDNGEIDGDSVSVYEENLQRINKKMITAKPITFYVSLDKDTSPISHLRLVAESLGSIPPCTALMIVTTKTKRYEVRLSSNFNKNATLELFLKQ